MKIRSKMNWVLFFLFTSQLVLAEPPQPEYDANVARIYTFVLLQEVVDVHCTKRFDEKVYDHGNYVNWAKTNRLVIVEIHAHFDAMIDNMAAKANVRREKEKSDLDAYFAQIEPTISKIIEQPDADVARNYCQIQSGLLRKNEDMLEEKYATGLKTIRNCHNDGTCPYLKP